MNKNIICIVVCVLAILLLTVLDSRGQGYTLRDAAFVGAANVASTGGGGGGSPAFSREDTRITQTDSVSPSVVDIQSDITTGKRAVLIIQWRGAQTISGITDSDGNTWTINSTNYPASSMHVVIASTVTGATLSASDSISIAWGAAEYSFRSWALFVIDNSTGGEDVEATSDTYNTTVSASATTTAATSIIGVVSIDDTPTYSGSSFTVIGSAFDWGSGKRAYFVRSDEASTGSKNVGGTLSVATSHGATWTAFK